jgi:hypothetical protein
MPVQAAEVALRRQLGETRGDAVRFLRRARDGAVTRAWFEVAGARWEVAVETTPGAAHRLTCGVERRSPVPQHAVLEVRRS